MKKLLALFAAAIGFVAGAFADTYDLSIVKAHTTLSGVGHVLTGKLAKNIKISLADGAKFTFKDVTIKPQSNVDSYKKDYSWAGLTCEGDATIILEGDNAISAFYLDYPAIYVPNGKTLTIKGSGSLVASSPGYGAGIGGGWDINCGNIVIESGTVTAKCGSGGAGIGAGPGALCGNITINGGSVTATGGWANSENSTSYGHDGIRIYGGAGIGCSYNCTGCGKITINGGTVVATGRDEAAGIGSGKTSRCGDIVINGGTVRATGGWHAAGIGSGSGSCGNITIARDVNSGGKVVEVRATHGNGAANPIGAGLDGSCGDVSIEASYANAVQTCYVGQIDLSSLIGGITVANGMTLTGRLAGNHKVSIEAGARILLSNATILGENDSYCTWAGLTCLGNAEIYLKDFNTVKGFFQEYPGVYVPSGSKLTIRSWGWGSLTASSNGKAAGIGGGLAADVYNCGSIDIGGNVKITATGGGTAAGIGGCDTGSCGTISIGTTSGTSNKLTGSVTATCGSGHTIPIGKGKGGPAVTVSVASGLVDTTSGKTRTIIPSGGDLATLTGNKTFDDGSVLTGTLSGNYKISIADGATVTLRDVTINGVNDSSYKWAGITCEGDAIIVLEGTNTVSGFYEKHPGIYVPVGKTVGLCGEGFLDVKSNNDHLYAAGIGGGWGIDCGNIAIQDCTITSTGNIGSGLNATCGDIVIFSGTVTAKGGSGAAGIGCGSAGVCGNIKIYPAITSVTATRGSHFAYEKPIGRGFGNASTCGEVVCCSGIDVEESDVVDTAKGGDTWTLTSCDLSRLTGDKTFHDDAVLYGSTSEDYKISIADGATVFLSDVGIYGFNGPDWAGINCLGNATIILAGENYVRGFDEFYPGIHVPEGHTLTIKGIGSLMAKSSGYGAGIGGGNKVSCGNIVIEDGDITAEGGTWAAGIGGGNRGNCGDITIKGGTITATGNSGLGGSNWGAGIGCGESASCGIITISGGDVSATGGSNAAGIGGARDSSCAGIVIGQGIVQVVATCGESRNVPIGLGGAAVTLNGNFVDETVDKTRTIKPDVGTYTVRYRKYDGSGETAEEDFERGKTYRLAWMDSQLGWMREGYEFCGWVPWNPDTKARLCKYDNGQPVKDLAAAGETIELYCGWKSSSSYRVCFHRCAGPDDLLKMNQVILRNKEDNLAWMDSMIGWKRDGYTFAGWDESEKATTVKYANGAKVKNLAMNGGTKHLYAVWRARDDHKYPYTVKFFRYDGSGETRTQSFKAGTVQNLLWLESGLGWSRPGYEFVGWVPWNPDTKARLCKYANGQKVVDLASKSGETVSLYAGWKSSSSYRVCFHMNDGTDVKMNQVILRNKEDSLAWMDSMIGWQREGYVFKGWAEKEGTSTVKYANGAKVKNLAMDGGTKHLYAVWKLAD